MLRQLYERSRATREMFCSRSIILVPRGSLTFPSNCAAVKCWELRDWSALGGVSWGQHSLVLTGLPREAFTYTVSKLLRAQPRRQCEPASACCQRIARGKG